MKRTQQLRRLTAPRFGVLAFVVWVGTSGWLPGAPATLLFEDNFTGGIPGWTAIQPTGGNYLDGPMIWQYDVPSSSFSEQSNIYTDNAAASPTRIAVMLINDTVAPSNFLYTARLTAGDDD